MSQEKEIKNLVKAFLDKDTSRILELAVTEHLYPNQIARNIGKSNSFVVKRLKLLEKLGIIKGRFETSEGKAVKKYELIGEKITLEINIKENGIRFKKEVTPRLVSEIIEKCPDLFESKKNYLSWLKGGIKAETISQRTGLPALKAEEIVKEVERSIDYYFIEALTKKLKKWKEEGEVFVSYKKDYIVIPTQRINDKVENISPALIKLISQGEISVSRLEEILGSPDIWDQIRVLAGKKMILLEEKIVPNLLFENISSVTEKEIIKPDGPELLYYLGKTTGREVYEVDKGKPLAFLNNILGGLVKTKEGEQIVISVPKCNIHGVKGERVCYFLAGFIEGVMETEYPGLKVEEIACKASDEGPCTFAIKKRKPGLEDKVIERFKKLLG
jgi:predicted hydrocarbon binding protein